MHPHALPASLTPRQAQPRSEAGPAAACDLAPPLHGSPRCPSAAPCPSFSSSPFLQPDGCPDLCNGNGRCTLGQNSWQCVCQTGWRGPGCNVAMETSCADNKDNEGGERASSNSRPLKNRAWHLYGRHESLFLKDLPYTVVRYCRDISCEANAVSSGQWGAPGDTGCRRRGLMCTERGLGPGSAFGYPVLPDPSGLGATNTSRPLVTTAVPSCLRMHPFLQP